MMRTVFIDGIGIGIDKIAGNYPVTLYLPNGHKIRVSEQQLRDLSVACRVALGES